MPLLDTPTAYEEWWTPQHVLEAARQALGGIDLDPASCAGANERVRATSYLTAQDSPHACDSSRRWHGRVWLNPPYTNGIIDRFVGKLISEYEHPDGGTTAAILLTNNCSDTRWFHLALSRASCVCLVRDRLWFSRMGAPGKRAARGQVIFYFGPDVERFMHAFARIGGFVRAVT